MTNYEIDFVMATIKKYNLSTRDVSAIIGFGLSHTTHLLIEWHSGKNHCFNNGPYRLIKEFIDKLNDCGCFMFILRDFMKKNNYTVIDVAALLNLKKDAVRKWFYGKTVPLPENLDSFLKLL